MKIEEVLEQSPVKHLGKKRSGIGVTDYTGGNGDHREENGDHREENGDRNRNREGSRKRVH